MRVRQENFTVIPYPEQGEISVLIAGLNVVLDLDEVRELTRQLLSGMHMLSRAAHAPDWILATRTPDPVAEKAAASLRDTSAGNGPAAAGAAEETLMLSSSETPVTLAPADDTTGDKRGGKRLRGLFKVLGREEDGAAASGR
jgi:hypothetical protein